MSRLADRLSGIDRGAVGPSGMGAIPRLAGGRMPVRNWRRGLLFAIVGGMLAAGMAVTMWPTKVAVTLPRTTPPATAVPSPPPLPPAAPERFRALVRRAHDAARAGSLAEAIASFREALQLRPNDADVWSDLGVVLVGRGDVDEGIAALRRALRANPSLAGAHRNLAVALDRRGQSRDALAHYQAFLGLAPHGDRARDEVTRRVAEVEAAVGK